MTIFYIFLAIVVIVSLFTGLIVSVVEKRNLGTNHVVVNEVVKTVVVPKEVTKEVIKEVPVEVIKEVEKEVPVELIREVEKVPDPNYDGVTKVFKNILPISDDLRSRVSLNSKNEDLNNINDKVEAMNKVVIEDEDYNTPKIITIIDEELI